ncbi:MAG: hypothetical protein GF388_08145 [Candidatus Aegiribacteria sp.]|nr:hypothetical protein [Candidatus Aegiribacteria sp.]MBD3295059.1 hypothetical protein [Candidatus Fermentibacteria bacterium]
MASPADFLKRNRAHISAAAIMLVLSAAVTWPMAISGRSYDRSDTLFNSWLLSWNFHAAANFDDPLEPPIFLGQPDGSGRNDFLFTQTLAGMPLLAAGLTPLRVHNILFVLSLAFAGLAGYLLALRIRIPVPGAVFAGGALVCLPFFQSHLWHLQLMSAGLWILALERAFHVVEKPPGGWSIAVLILLQGLACLYYWLFLNVSLVVLLAFLALGKNWKALKSIALRMLAGNLPMLLLLAGHLRNAASFSPDVMMSADAASWLAPWDSSLLMSWMRSGHVIGEVALWPGLFVLAGALIFVFSQRLRSSLPWSNYMLATALFFGIIALGPTLVVFGRELAPAPFRLIAWLPGMNSIRLPARGAIFTLLFLILLAARWVGRRRLLASLGILLCFLEVFSGGLDLKNVEIDPWHRWLAARDPESVVFIPVRADLSRPESECGRMYGQTVHFVPMVNGYSTSLPKAYPETARIFNSWPSPEAQSLMDSLNVECVITQDREIDSADTVWNTGSRRVYALLR